MIKCIFFLYFCFLKTMRLFSAPAVPDVEDEELGVD